jgi:hypothetical protein
MLTYLVCSFFNMAMAVGRSKLRSEYVAIPSFIPHGAASMTAEAVTGESALKPATPAAAPRKFRRDGWILIVQTDCNPSRLCGA